MQAPTAAVPRTRYARSGPLNIAYQVIGQGEIDLVFAAAPEEWDRTIDEIEAAWGGPVALESVAPSVADDPAVADWWAAYLRLGATPTGGAGLLRMNAQIDVRPLLPTISVLRVRGMAAEGLR